MHHYQTDTLNDTYWCLNCDKFFSVTEAEQYHPDDEIFLRCEECQEDKTRQQVIQFTEQETQHHENPEKKRTDNDCPCRCDTPLRTT